MSKLLVPLLLAIALFAAYSAAEPINGRAYDSVIGMLRKREPANMRGYNALYGRRLSWSHSKANFLFSDMLKRSGPMRKREPLNARQAVSVLDLL